MAKAIGALRMLGLHAKLLRKKQIPDWRRRMQFARSGGDGAAINGAAAASDLASGSVVEGGATVRSLVVTHDLCRDMLADFEFVCMAGQACDDWTSAAARAAANSTPQCVRPPLTCKPHAKPCFSVTFGLRWGTAVYQRTVDAMPTAAYRRSPPSVLATLLETSAYIGEFLAQFKVPPDA